MTGPSTAIAPMCTALSTPNATTMSHTQVREVNSPHPSRNSAMTEGDAVTLRSRPGRATCRSMGMATRNNAESTSSAQPGPAPTTRAPASAGPTMVMELRLKDSRALACWMRSGPTTSGTTPIIAGIPNADTAPLTASSATRCQICAVPVRTRYAAIP
ncbi:MAG: hypothetical protein BWY91_03286 [bacterium ADurb.BinA028]|nr:MAG: hypothetical protein BWY91_03286 [bacterium ADurb.BinA028]